MAIILELYTLTQAIHLLRQSALEGRLLREYYESSQQSSLYRAGFVNFPSRLTSTTPRVISYSLVHAIARNSLSRTDAWSKLAIVRNMKFASVIYLQLD
ncbi:hypothetical protein BofuT4_uP128600.1 [Botrytis cinerea T4]|uniref:Uncharacterized protein n=1 Tax=Botryotinia fuckeliana (strain T4) TaxID=999810 RepID=G2YRB2_BOTF4|nr:hypothetical protein BofuT4_uP128600.1 [Botrytis cinerea T4]